MSRPSMLRLLLRLAASAVALCMPALAAASPTPATIDLAHTPAITASQIVERNIAARGGREAWRNVQTMIWIGHMDSLHAPDPRMGFVLAQKRPNKTRFEVNALSQKTWRVFDGVQGWKQRPDSEGRPDVQPFSARELQFARQAVVIDAPLIDADSRALPVELDGEESIDGHRTYRLLVGQAPAQRRRVWVDAQSFLDVRYERVSYTSAGVPVLLSVDCRDFKDFAGLQIPTIVETGSPARGGPVDKMVIEQVAINSPVDDQVFQRPGTGRRMRGEAGMAQSMRNAGRWPNAPDPAPTNAPATP